MEIGPIASPAALDALVALAAPLETGEATVAEAIEPTASAAPMHEDFGEHLLSQAQPHAAAEPSQVPAAAADPLTETATAQTFVRAQPQTDASPTKADTTLPSAAHALSEFAVPASQLVPTMVIGLQVEPARILPQPTTPLPTRPAARDNDEPHAGGMPYEDSPEQPDAQEEHTDREPASPASEPDTLHDAGNDGGCEAIARVLHTALAATTPPPALLAAADQWQRGRCVVFACPQCALPDGPAWAFVLWPRHSTAHGTPKGLRFTLRGRRIEARLHWTVTPHSERWCHMRLVKDHHPHQGRQLLPMDGHTATVACEVQLGPVLVEHPRPCEVRLRIHAVRKLWAALGDQWSVHLVVCSLPLAGDGHTLVEDLSC